MGNSNEVRRRSGWRLALTGVRRSVAGLFLIWGFLTVVPTPLTSVDDDCTRVTRSGDNGTAPRVANETTATCAQPPVTDLTPFVLLAVLVLVPDVSEIGVPGLITLKRRVEEQEKKADAQDARITTLQASLQAAVSQASSNLYLHLDYARGIVEKGAELDRPDVVQGAAPESRGQRERSIFLRRLREGVERIDALEAEMRSLDSQSTRYALLERWQNLYSDDIARARDVSATATDNPYAVPLSYLRDLAEGVDNMIAMLD